MQVTINAQTIIQIIRTLKSIKVRGYESMDKIVGLVILFENMLNSASEAAAPNLEVVPGGTEKQEQEGE